MTYKGSESWLTRIIEQAQRKEYNVEVIKMLDDELRSLENRIDLGVRTTQDVLIDKMNEIIYALNEHGEAHKTGGKIQHC